jgi:hypothetical protein
MHIIYCLKNESFKENILSIGITNSESSLQQIIEDINNNFLPTPYTILLLKNIYNNCIDILYSLLCKIGNHINGTFFEISPEIVKQIFELIQSDTDIYRIVQGDIEYIIPKADVCEYSTSNDINLNTTCSQYDHLFIFRNKNNLHDLNDLHDINDLNDLDL